MLYGQFHSEIFLADGIVLAETAAQSAAGKKDGSASFITTDAGFFPVVQGSPGSPDSVSAAAVSSGLMAVYLTVSWTEAAGIIHMVKIHKNHSCC